MARLVAVSPAATISATATATTGAFFARTRDLTCADPGGVQEPESVSTFVLLTSGSERANRVKIKTLAYQTFGVLGGRSLGWALYSNEPGGEVERSSSFELGAAALSGPFGGSGSATEVNLPPLGVTVSVMVSPSANGLPRLRIS